MAEERREQEVRTRDGMPPESCETFPLKADPYRKREEEREQEVEEQKVRDAAIILRDLLIKETTLTGGGRRKSARRRSGGSRRCGPGAGCPHPTIPTSSFLPSMLMRLHAS